MAAIAFAHCCACPGLVRTGGDFAIVAATLGEGRRVIAPDYAGRGESGRARAASRYAPEACVRDVLDICAALHVHGAVGIGTSFGGLLCMGIAAARHSLLHAVVLNDVGPEIGGDGADFVRRFVATDPALPSVEACVAICAPCCRRCRCTATRTGRPWRG